MFSLIISIVSIALVAVLAIATIYYGGTAFNKSSAEADALQLKSQGEQILNAMVLYRTDHGAWPTSQSDLLTPDSTGRSYLKSWPYGVTAQTNHLAHMVQAASGGTWTIVPGRPVVKYTLNVSEDVCRSVNKLSRGDNGIMSKLSTQYGSQCYAPGVSTAYTVVIAQNPFDDLEFVDPDNVVNDEAPVGADDSGLWNKAPIRNTPKGILSYSSLVFSDVQVGLPQTKSVVLTNTGSAALTISGVSSSLSSDILTLDYGQCVTGEPLLPDDSCTITASYTADLEIVRTGFINVVTSNTGPKSYSVQVVANPPVTAEESPQLDVSANSLTFNALAGQVTGTQQFEVQNIGSRILSNLTLETVNTAYTVTHNCTSDLLPAASCLVEVKALFPLTTTPTGGSVVVRSNGGNKTVALSSTLNDISPSEQMQLSIIGNFNRTVDVSTAPPSEVWTYYVKNTGFDTVSNINVAIDTYVYGMNTMPVLSKDECTGQTLGSLQTCEINITVDNTFLQSSYLDINIYVDGLTLQSESVSKVATIHETVTESDLPVIELSAYNPVLNLETGEGVTSVQYLMRNIGGGILRTASPRIVGVEGSLPLGSLLKGASFSCNKEGFGTDEDSWLLEGRTADYCLLTLNIDPKFTGQFKNNIVFPHLWSIKGPHREITVASTSITVNISGPIAPVPELKVSYMGAPAEGTTHIHYDAVDWLDRWAVRDTFGKITLWNTGTGIMTVNPDIFQHDPYPYYFDCAEGVSPVNPYDWLNILNPSDSYEWVSGYNPSDWDNMLDPTKISCDIYVGGSYAKQPVSDTEVLTVNTSGGTHSIELSGLGHRLGFRIEGDSYSPQYEPQEWPAYYAPHLVTLSVYEDNPPWFSARVSVEVVNRGSGKATIHSITTDNPRFTVSEECIGPEHFNQSSEHGGLQICWFGVYPDLTGLSANTSHSTMVTIVSSGGTYQIPIIMDVVVNPDPPYLELSEVQSTTSGGYGATPTSKSFVLTNYGGRPARIQGVGAVSYTDETNTAGDVLSDSMTSEITCSTVTPGVLRNNRTDFCTLTEHYYFSEVAPYNTATMASRIRYDDHQGGVLGQTISKFNTTQVWPSEHWHYDYGRSFGINTGTSLNMCQNRNTSYVGASLAKNSGVTYNGYSLSASNASIISELTCESLLAGSASAQSTLGVHYCQSKPSTNTEKFFKLTSNTPGTFYFTYMPKLFAPKHYLLNGVPAQEMMAVGEPASFSVTVHAEGTNGCPVSPPPYTADPAATTTPVPSPTPSTLAPPSSPQTMNICKSEAVPADFYITSGITYTAPTCPSGEGYSLTRIVASEYPLGARVKVCSTPVAPIGFELEGNAGYCPGTTTATAVLGYYQYVKR